ncbi:MAG: class I SAM-dependent methyltransferase [Chloroflexi bacterium]|nr:class I SAM-dependent methyltransferase [Chloroflexota bacterium]
MIFSAQQFSFACPRCHTPLEEVHSKEFRCPKDNISFLNSNGVWLLLDPERHAHYEQFIYEYETVRQDEGRGSHDPAYYQALPFKDLTGRMDRDWSIRAKSYRSLEKEVIKPNEKVDGPLKILDLGAGNCWLSNQLAIRGHFLAAVDLLINPEDGLGAHVHYPVDFVPVQAEYDRLPFNQDQFDVAIFNSSFHYSDDYEYTLKETLNCLKPNGVVIILDTPVYLDGDSGRRMIAEREEHFEKKYGFPSNSLKSEGFLTHERLDQLGNKLGLNWEFHKPFYGLRWALRPWKAKFRGGREPAEFLVIVGKLT